MGIVNINAGQRIWSFLRSHGFSQAGTAGAMANIYAESAFVADALQTAYMKSLGFTSNAAYTNAVDNGEYTNFVHDSAGYGLCQWTYWSRKENLWNRAKAAGVSIGDEAMQLNFFLEELKGYKDLLDLLKTSEDYREACEAVMLQYEQPADQSLAARNRRASFAEDIYTRYTAAEETAVSAESEVASDSTLPAIEPDSTSPSVTTVAAGGITSTSEEKGDNDTMAVGTLITAAHSPATIHGITMNKTLRCHVTNFNSVSSRVVTKLVAHYTGNSKDTAYNNAKYYSTHARVGASAHYFVDETSMFESIPPQSVSWHSGNRTVNWNSIGIEMCCSGNYTVSEKTKKNAAYLFAYWCKVLNISSAQVDTYIIRHYDVTGKLCPKQMAGANNAQWKAFKQMIKDILETGSIRAETPAVTTVSAKTTSSYPAVPFGVTITATALNVRSGPGTTYRTSAEPMKKNDTAVIIDTSENGWGKLQSGQGWISLTYVKIGSTISSEPVLSNLVATTTATAQPDISVRNKVDYLVKITADVLNVRTGPGTSYAKVTSVKKGQIYTIVETQGKWGKLKSGAGWICLENYTALMV